jgi:hypothetical protein
MVTKKTAKKPPKIVKKVKKVTSKHSTSKKPAPMKSFHMYKEEKPFTRLQLSRQTLYWVILLVFIVITQLWILKIQMDIANLTALLTN